MLMSTEEGGALLPVGRDKTAQPPWKPGWQPFTWSGLLSDRAVVPLGASVWGDGRSGPRNTCKRLLTAAISVTATTHKPCPSMKGCTRRGASIWRAAPSSLRRRGALAPAATRMSPENTALREKPVAGGHLSQDFAWRKPPRRTQPQTEESRIAVGSREEGQG